MMHSFVVISNFDTLQYKCTFYILQDMLYLGSMLNGATRGRHRIALVRNYFFVLLFTYELTDNFENVCYI